MHCTLHPKQSPHSIAGSDVVGGVSVGLRQQPFSSFCSIMTECSKRLTLFCKIEFASSRRLNFCCNSLTSLTSKATVGSLVGGTVAGAGVGTTVGSTIGGTVVGAGVGRGRGSGPRRRRTYRRRR